MGAIITGISSGNETALFVAMISWFAILRILIVAIWELYEAIRPRPLKGDAQFFDFLRVFSCKPFPDKAASAPPTFLGRI